MRNITKLLIAGMIIMGISMYMGYQVGCSIWNVYK